MSISSNMLYWSGVIPLDLTVLPRSEVVRPSLSSFVFAHHSGFAPEWQVVADTTDHSPPTLTTTMFVVTARSLSKLRIGTHVDVQDPVPNFGPSVVSSLLPVALVISR